MTVHNDKTPQGWPLPHPENRLEEDVLRLRSALNAIDGAVQYLDQALTSQAQTSALDLAAVQQTLTQSLSAGLQSTGQQITALQNAIATKAVDLQAVAKASNTAQAVAGDVALRRMRQGHSNSLTNDTPFEAGVEYSLYTDTAYSRPLPFAPAIGDAITLTDPWGFWKRGVFTLRRGNPAHLINGRAEDVVFNVEAWRVTLTYAWHNNWSLSIG
jgi:hypothetical protein